MLHLLFDPKQDAPLDVPPRFRTNSPDIYTEFSRDLAKGFENLVGQPFSPNGHTHRRTANVSRGRSMSAAASSNDGNGTQRCIA